MGGENAYQFAKAIGFYGDCLCSYRTNGGATQWAAGNLRWIHKRRRRRPENSKNWNVLTFSEVCAVSLGGFKYSIQNVSLACAAGIVELRPILGINWKARVNSNLKGTLFSSSWWDYWNYCTQSRERNLLQFSELQNFKRHSPRWCQFNGGTTRRIDVHHNSRFLRENVAFNMNAFHHSLTTIDANSMVYISSWHFRNDFVAGESWSDRRTKPPSNSIMHVNVDLKAPPQRGERHQSEFEVFSCLLFCRGPKCIWKLSPIRVVKPSILIWKEAFIQRSAVGYFGPPMNASSENQSDNHHQTKSRNECQRLLNQYTAIQWNLFTEDLQIDLVKLRDQKFYVWPTFF